MMVKNEEFYKDLIRTKYILDNYYRVKNAYDINSESELNECRFDHYTSLRIMLENSCTEHIPVILGVNRTKIYNYKTDEYVEAKFRRCVCCGKMLPLEIEMENEIDVSFNNENNTYNYLNKKFFELLDLFISISKDSNNKNEAIKNFIDYIEEEKEILIKKKSIKK